MPTSPWIAGYRPGDAGRDSGWGTECADCSRGAARRERTARRPSHAARVGVCGAGGADSYRAASRERTARRPGDAARGPGRAASGAGFSRCAETGGCAVRCRFGPDGRPGYT